jgi:hypothetical protein
MDIFTRKSKKTIEAVIVVGLKLLPTAKFIMMQFYRCMKQGNLVLHFTLGNLNL